MAVIQVAILSRQSSAQLGRVLANYLLMEAVELNHLILFL